MSIPIIRSSWNFHTFYIEICGSIISMRHIQCNPTVDKFLANSLLTLHKYSYMFILY